MPKLFLSKGDIKDNAELFSFVNNSMESSSGRAKFTSILPKIYKKDYNPAADTFILRTENDEWLAVLPVFYNYISISGFDISAAFTGRIIKSRITNSSVNLNSIYDIMIKDILSKHTDIAFMSANKSEASGLSFYRGGEKIFIRVSKPSLSPVNKVVANITTKVQPIDENNALLIEEADKMYKSRLMSVQRPEEKLFDIFSSWGGRAYSVFKSNNFSGYFVLSLSGDVVYEICSADPSDFAEVVAAVFNVSSRSSVTFSMPEFATHENEYLLSVCDKYSIADCANINILNYKNVLTACLSLKAQTDKLHNGEAVFLIHGFAGPEKLNIKIEDSVITVESTNKPFDIELSASAATEIFFAPKSVKRKSLPANINGWFPLPLFISEIDEV